MERKKESALGCGLTGQLTQAARLESLLQRRHLSHQCSKERLHVRNQTDGLKRSPVGKLDAGGGIDVYAHDLDPGRKQVAHGDGVERGGD